MALDPNEQFTNNADIEKYATCKNCVFRAYDRNPAGDYRRAGCAMYQYPFFKPETVYNGGECKYYALELQQENQ